MNTEKAKDYPCYKVAMLPCSHDDVVKISKYQLVLKR